MTRVNIVLSIALIGCALGLVASQHSARKLFIELERSQGKAHQLDVHWEQLLVEQTGLAKASLIDSKARRGLAMTSVSADRTLHLSVDTQPDKTAMGAGR